MSTSLLTQVILKTVKKLSASDLSGVSKIRVYFLYKCTSLTNLELPESVTYIGKSAFEGCTGLVTLSLPNSVTYIGTSAFEGCTGLVSVNNLDNLSPYCEIHSDVFTNTTWLKNQTGLVFAANGKILVYACSDVTDKTIPDTVINLAYGSCDNLVEDSSFAIPDTIEICTGKPVTSNITKLVVGASLSKMGTGLIPTTVTTLICRQPAGMEITLPTPGDGTGLTYSKNSRSMSIYTDNECIKNYSWSGDNVTATFYPLSDATA